MARITVRRRVTRIDLDSGVHRVEDVLAAEEPLEIRVGGRSLAVTMRTPGHDVELAAGFLVSEGVVTAAEHVVAARYCAGADRRGPQHLQRPRRHAGPRRPRTRPEPRALLLHDVVLRAVRQGQHRRRPHALALDGRRRRARPVAPTCWRRSRTGSASTRRCSPRRAGCTPPALFDGAHRRAARAARGRRPPQRRRQGGRVGAARAAGCPLRGTVLMVSGRASFELTQKALMAGIPVLAAVSAPSSLAVDLAQEAGITLVGFLRGSSMVVYSRPERVARAGCTSDGPRAAGSPSTRPRRGPSGCPSVVSAHGLRARRPGPEPRAEAAHQGEPEGRLRLHELRVAGPGAPRAGRVLRERRPRGRRGRPRRRPSPTSFWAEHSLTDLLDTVGVLAGPAGQARRARPQARRQRPLRPDQLGRRVPARRRQAARARLARTRPRSTRAAAPPTRRRSSTSCSCAPSAPTTCPTAPTCATSRPAPRCSPRSASGSRPIAYDDFAKADLIIVMGQNPGTNHPRMLTALEDAKRHGATIVSVNPLPEAGLRRYKNPQTVRGIVGRGTDLADQFLQIRSGGDMALLQWVSRRVLEAEDRAPGTVLDHEFLAEHTLGLDELRAHLATLDEQEVLTATGPDRGRDGPAGRALPRRRPRDHHVGDGADAAPQGRRHDQGDRQPPAAAREHRQAGRGRLPHPRAQQRAGRPHHGHLGADAGQLPRRARRRVLVRAAAQARARLRAVDRGDARGEIKVWFALGGNLVAAISDTAAAEAAMRGDRPDRAGVDQAQPLARRHRRRGAHPADARPHRRRPPGDRTAVRVRRGLACAPSTPRHGPLPPVSDLLLSEVSIVTRLARAVLGDDGPIDWAGFERDYDTIRDSISRVVPGFERLQPTGPSPGRLRPAQRPARLPDLPDGRPARPCSRSTSSSPSSARPAG